LGEYILNLRLGLFQLRVDNPMPAVNLLLLLRENLTEVLAQQCTGFHAVATVVSPDDFVGYIVEVDINVGQEGDMR
jgi:hypothetical protein